MPALPFVTTLATFRHHHRCSFELVNFHQQVGATISLLALHGGRWILQHAVLIKHGVAVQGGDSGQLTMNSCSATPHRR
jgi:hypothetical protein